MMSWFTRVLAGTTLPLLLACGPPRLDMSSPQASAASVERVRSSLPASQRPDFDQALGLIAYRNLEDAELFARSRVESSRPFEIGVVPELDGLSGREVLETGRRLHIELSLTAVEGQRQRRESQRREIDRLEARRSSAESAQQHLDAFEVTHAAFSPATAEARPRIDLVVTNGTSSTIERARFLVRLEVPGRMEAAFEGQFDYRPTEGLAAGAVGAWTIEFNRYDRWGSLEPSPGSRFAVTPIRLDTDEGRSLFRSHRFSERDARKLERLRGN
ncbi:MAG: DUF6694 family lipoprotein [Acidobacteriota bacterium]